MPFPSANGTVADGHWQDRALPTPTPPPPHQPPAGGNRGPPGPCLPDVIKVAVWRALLRLELLVAVEHDVEVELLLQQHQTGVAERLDRAKGRHLRAKVRVRVNAGVDVKVGARVPCLEDALHVGEEVPGGAGQLDQLLPLALVRVHLTRSGGEDKREWVLLHGHGCCSKIGSHFEVQGMGSSSSGGRQLAARRQRPAGQGQQYHVGSCSQPSSALPPVTW